MKKKIVVAFVTGFIVVAMLCGLVACDKSENSDLGEESSYEEWGDVYTLDAAYAEAVALGYDGTLEEFIESISGKDGSDGKDGLDGVGISSVVINSDGELVVTLTNGETTNLGVVVGSDGKDGQDGKDGVGIVSMSVNESGELVVTYSDGTTQNLGNVVGSDGVGISNLGLNAYGELVISLTDGTEVNLGNFVSGLCPHVLIDWDEDGYESDYEYHYYFCPICGAFVREKHNLDENGLCDVCGGADYTVELRFRLINDDSEYEVYDIGRCGVESIVIPSSYKGLPVTSIGDSGSTNYIVKKVVIPDSVTTIGDNAFDYCVALTSVDIPESVTSIGNTAFCSCYSFASISIPSSVTSIGDEAFCNCYSLSRVYITDLEAWCSIEFKGDSANPLCYGADLYLNNQLITKLAIPISVTSLSDYAFYGCTSLTSITIPDSVTTIGNFVFEYCTSLTSVTFGESVTSIGNYAFFRCTSLTAIIISDSVTTIGNDAFFDCSSLEAVYYTGSSSDWSGISIGTSNGPLTDATIYYYSETEPEDAGNFWHYGEDGEPVAWSSVSSETVPFSDMTDADAAALFAVIKTLYGYEGSYTVKNTDQNSGDIYVWDDDGQHYETAVLIDCFIYSYDAESGYLAYECSSPYLWCYDDEVLEDSMWINNIYYVPAGDGVLYVYTYTYDSEEDDEPEMTMICVTESYSSYTSRIGILTGNYLKYYLVDIMNGDEWTTVGATESFMLDYWDVCEDDDTYSDVATAMQVSESDGETIYKLSVSFTYGDYDAEKPDYAEMMTYEFVFFVDGDGVMTGFLYFEDYRYKELWNGEYEEGRYVYYDYYEVLYEFDESYRLSDEDAAQYLYE